MVAKACSSTGVAVCAAKGTLKLAACPEGKTRLADTSCGGGSSCVASRPCVLSPSLEGTTAYAEGQFTLKLSCSADGEKQCVDGQDE